MDLRGGRVGAQPVVDNSVRPGKISQCVWGKTNKTLQACNTAPPQPAAAQCSEQRGPLPTHLQVLRQERVLGVPAAAGTWEEPSARDRQLRQQP